MYERAQMNKGLLEGCILQIIAQKSSYGYDIISRLTEAGFPNVRESTIYPLLLRLDKKNYITSFYEPSAIGPARKYYRITGDGVQYLHEFAAAWRETEHSVNTILETEE